MKSSILILLLLLSSITLLTNCSGDEYNENIFKSNATGAPGKILIVLEKKYWGSDLEKAIIEHFQRDITTLPQPEKTFSIEISARKSFTKELKTQHTIVIFDIGDKANNRNARLEDATQDMWSIGQVVYKFRASNQRSATALFLLEVDQLIDELNENSRNKLMREYDFKGSAEVVNQLSEIQKVSISVPSDMTIDENYNGFSWLKRFRTKFAGNNEHEIQQGVIIYAYPYVDDSTFTIDYQIAKRDSVFKYSVPGPTQGSYMATELRFGMQPEFSQKMINGLYVFEMRGLWRVEGDLMGGPFISISMFDEPNNRIVTIEGYVYAPHFAKREYLREMEAMIYSYQFIE
jgi:hypothetical protein